MARLLDGSSQYLERTAAALSSYPFTMSCWFYPTAIPGGASGLMCIETNGTADHRHALAYVFDEKIYANSRTTSAANAITTTTATLNAWNHACGVWASAADRRAFLNAGSKGTNTTSITPSGMDRTRIGRYDPTPFYLQGGIAEAAIWNVALTDAEVSELYGGGIGAAPRFVRPDALVAYWRLLNSDGDVDWWGQNNLTAVNSPTYMSRPPIIYPDGIITTLPASAAAVSASRLLHLRRRVLA